MQQSGNSNLNSSTLQKNVAVNGNGQHCYKLVGIFVVVVKIEAQTHVPFEL